VHIHGGVELLDRESHAMLSLDNAQFRKQGESSPPKTGPRGGWAYSAGELFLRVRLTFTALSVRYAYRVRVLNS